MFQFSGGCDDNEVCPDIREPVCGSDNSTYFNKCELDLKACDFPEVKLHVKYSGSCTGKSPFIDFVVRLGFLKYCIVGYSLPHTKSTNVKHITHYVITNHCINFKWVTLSTDKAV